MSDEYTSPLPKPLPPDWDELFPTMADKWKQVAHELAAEIGDPGIYPDALAHYDAVTRIGFLAGIDTAFANLESGIAESQPTDKPPTL